MDRLCGISSDSVLVHRWQACPLTYVLNFFAGCRADGAAVVRMQRVHPLSPGAGGHR